MKSQLTIIIPAGNDTKVEAIKNIDVKHMSIIIERGKNPSKNRNNGIKKAKTPLIAFINAHTLLDESWFKEVIKFFKTHPEIDIVGGPQLNHPCEEFFARSSGYALSSYFGAAEASVRYKQTRLNLNASESILTAANLICRRKVFKKIKFDETLYPGEDPKFIEDSRKAGFKVAYSPEIVVYNLRRQNLGLLFKQIFYYGITRPQRKSIFKIMKKPYFLVPSLFLLYILFLPSLFIINKMFIFPLYAYISLNILFSFYESIKNKHLLSLFILPFLFFVIHISYGLGFITGLIKR